MQSALYCTVIVVVSASSSLLIPYYHCNLSRYPHRTVRTTVLLFTVHYFPRLFCCSVSTSPQREGMMESADPMKGAIIVVLMQNCRPSPKLPSPRNPDSILPIMAHELACKTRAGTPCTLLYKHDGYFPFWYLENHPRTQVALYRLLLGTLSLHTNKKMACYCKVAVSFKTTPVPIALYKNTIFASLLWGGFVFTVQHFQSRQ